MNPKFLQLAILLLMSGSLIAQQQPSSNNESAQPQQAATPPIAQQAVTPHTLLDGTPIKLRLSQTISSADAKVGQEVTFDVVDEVKVDNIIVLPKGGTAIGSVTEAEPKKWAGRGGKLNINISYARLLDQEKAALRAVKETKGGGHVGAMTAGMIGTAIVFFPAAPFLLFVHGKDITIPQGTEITSFVDGDMHLDMTKFGAPSVDSAANSSAASQAMLEIDSMPAGADIDIDGAFVGNTPSTVPLTLGTHKIKVSKKGFVDWDRKMNISGGKIHLHAALDAMAVTPAETAPAATTPSAAPATAPQQ